MRTIFIKARARLDILQIWLFIANGSLAAAIRVGTELETEIRELAAMPGKGYRRKGIKNPRSRCWPFYSYLIFYQFDGESITIIRVLHGRRHVASRIPGR